MFTSVQKINERNDDGTLTSTFSDIYKVVLDDGTVTFVPHVTDNTDYQAILEWASQDDNTIQDAS